MAERDVVVLTKYQLSRATDTVRNMARRLGVNYAIWPHVREIMDGTKIDPIDVADWLARANVQDVLEMVGFTRYRLVPDEQNDEITGMTVAIHDEHLTIEIMALRVKER